MRRSVAKIGYFLSCEQFGPKELVEQAKRAEAAGFEALWVSDHFHPWNDEQGQSPFVWGVIGAVSEAASLPVTTPVTCPTIRIHPAIIAQASATAGVQLDGKFVLGVGSGEALNEHVLGHAWPSVGVRQQMLEEAVDVIRLLHRGDEISHHGRVLRSTGSTYLHAARPTRADLRFRLRTPGRGTRRPDRRRLLHRDARRRTREDISGSRRWRQTRPGRNQGQLGTATRTPPLTSHTGCGPTRACRDSWRRRCPAKDFADAMTLVPREAVAESVACGPDADKHIAQVRKYLDADVDEVYVQQIGPDTDGFFTSWERDVLPQLRN
jgi:hypothetical protein